MPSNFETFIYDPSWVLPKMLKACVRYSLKIHYTYDLITKMNLQQQCLPAFAVPENQNFMSPWLMLNYCFRLSEASSFRRKKISMLNKLNDIYIGFSKSNKIRTLCMFRRKTFMDTLSFCK